MTLYLRLRDGSKPTRRDNLARRHRVHGTETTTRLQRTPNPGVTRSRAEFLDYIAQPRPFKDLAVHDVNIRILSDVALIHGRSTYTTLADGVDQEALYTDTYQKREGT
jgi:hypothetical protein